MTNKNALDEYYRTCPFPKPGKAKKQKPQNGYKDKPNRHCWYCGKDYAERHEVFGGPFREISIELGFQVDVCPIHHRSLHQSADNWARIENRKWVMYYQQKWEEEQIAEGRDPETVREAWIDMMGRNYL